MIASHRESGAIPKDPRDQHPDDTQGLVPPHLA